MNEVSYKLQTTRCCPPQGRELLQKKIINYHIPLSCCPPQGRELLRQKCEKYNADFRHSYNLFVLSSVFLRIHS